MARLTNTGLETTPAGTSNLVGLINGNWTILENLFTAETWQWLRRTARATIAFNVNTALSFTGARIQTITLTNNITFTFANMAAGREVKLIMNGSGADRTMTFPSGVVWLGGAPANVPNGKTIMVTLYCQTSAASGVLAQYSLEP